MTAGRREKADLVASQPLVLTLLFACVTINLFDRQMINILAQDIKDDLRLSDAQLGLITGTAFAVFKAGVSVPVAWWADRLDRAKVLAILLAIWSVFTTICGAAGGFGTLALARMAFGAGESGGLSIATALARDHYPKRATSALAIMSAGNPFGTFLAFLLGGFIAQHWGWRVAMIAAGGPGLILAWMVWVGVKDIRTERRRSAGGSDLARDVVSLLRNRPTPPLLGATFASMFLVSAANAWLPAFFIRVHGLSTGAIGFFGAIAIGLGGGLGTLGGGVICDSLRGRISNPESKLMLVSLGLSVPCLMMTVFASTTTGALVGFWIYNLVAYAWLGPTIRLIQDSVEVDDRALAIAICSSVAVLLALAIGLPLTGWISDILSPALGAQSVGIALLITSSTAAAVGIASHCALMFRAIRYENTAI